MEKKKISIATGCYNEEGNLEELYDRMRKTLAQFPQYDYEIVVADNCSTDGSREVLRRIAAQDKNFKVIFNSNNFGHIRSPFNALLQTTGDATVMMCSDLQEPPEMIVEFIRKWEEGYEVVVAVKPRSKEFFLMALVRKFYYLLLSLISSSNDIICNFTGFGLYDRKFMNALRKYHDPYPYFRGLVSEIGFRRAEIEFVQQKRKHGKTKNNFFTLYDMAMTGFVNHSKLPLRLATFSGFCMAGV
ncbi:MAG: glycosyltransferase family 2 protein, partial [Victivallaceae bacterium]